MFIHICLSINDWEKYAHCLSAPELAWQAAFKRTKVKLDLLINIDMLLMVEKEIRGGVCHAIHQYAKANSKYMKDYDKNKESSYIMYLDMNKLVWVGNVANVICK